MIDRRLGGVEVLGAVPFEDAGTEADSVSPDIEDRKHDPSAEAIDQAPPARPGGEAGAHHRVIADPFVSEVLDQLIPIVG